LKLKKKTTTEGGTKGMVSFDFPKETTKKNAHRVSVRGKKRKNNKRLVSFKEKFLNSMLFFFSLFVTLSRLFGTSFFV